MDCLHKTFFNSTIWVKMGGILHATISGGGFENIHIFDKNSC